MVSRALILAILGLNVTLNPAIAQTIEVNPTSTLETESNTTSIGVNNPSFYNSGGEESTVGIGPNNCFYQENTISPEAYIGNNNTEVTTRNNSVETNTFGLRGGVRGKFVLGSSARQSCKELGEYYVQSAKTSNYLQCVNAHVLYNKLSPELQAAVGEPPSSCSANNAEEAEQE